MPTIRPIVKAAFRVNELHVQFHDIDVPDGYLETGSMKEVNEKYSDEYIIKEARNKLDIAEDEGWDHDEDVLKDRRQLRRFIKRWSA